MARVVSSTACFCARAIASAMLPVPSKAISTSTGEEVALEDARALLALPAHSTSTRRDANAKPATAVGSRSAKELRMPMAAPEI